MRLQTRQLLINNDRRDMADAAEHRILRKANENPRDPRVKRVIRLVTLIREAEELRLKLWRHCLYLESDAFDFHTRLRHGDEIAAHQFTDPEMNAAVKKLWGKLAEIREMGKRYRWSPTLRAGGFHDLGQRFIWSTRNEGQNWENWAVFWLFWHSETSGLTPSPALRIRQCRQCNRWFYAITDHQQHCSAACRQKFHASSSEFRAKRAKYMKERYRPEERRRELEAMDNARSEK